MFIVFISVNREGTFCTGGHKHVPCNIPWSLQIKVGYIFKTGWKLLMQTGIKGNQYDLHAEIQ